MSPDVSASVRARLLDKAKARREEFERTLTRFAAERWLYRLGVSPVRERCILKGASLVAAWVPEPYRVTRDIDMLARGPADEPAIRGLVETVCAVPCPEDGLTFDLSKLTLEPIRAEDEYVGTRARFVALLSNARIRVQLDFGVGDALTATPGEIDLPTLLDTLPRPRVRAYPPEASVAEKFQAMVSLGTDNSRMKDFHDLWALRPAAVVPRFQPARRRPASRGPGRFEPLVMGGPRILPAVEDEISPRGRDLVRRRSAASRPPCLHGSLVVTGQ